MLCADPAICRESPLPPNVAAAAPRVDSAPQGAGKLSDLVAALCQRAWSDESTRRFLIAAAASAGLHLGLLLGVFVYVWAAAFFARGGDANLALLNGRHASMANSVSSAASLGSKGNDASGVITVVSVRAASVRNEPPRAVAATPTPRPIEAQRAERRSDPPPPPLAPRMSKPQPAANVEPKQLVPQARAELLALPRPTSPPPVLARPVLASAERPAAVMPATSEAPAIPDPAVRAETQTPQPSRETAVTGQAERTLRSSPSRASRGGTPDLAGMGGTDDPPIPRLAHSPLIRPAEPEARGLVGVVMLEVDVSADGRVADVRLWKDSGHEVLDRSALRQVRNWRFRMRTNAGVVVAPQTVTAEARFNPE